MPDISPATEATEPAETLPASRTLPFDLLTDNVHEGYIPKPIEIDDSRVRQPAAYPPISEDYGTPTHPSTINDRIEATLYRIRSDWMLQHFPSSDITAIFHQALFFRQLETLVEDWVLLSALESEAEKYYAAIARLKRGSLTATASCEAGIPVLLPLDVRARIFET